MVDRPTPPPVSPGTGWVVWFTGLPAAGKTTLARHLQAALRARGVQALILDSDALRRVLTPEPRYTAAERDDFYHRLVELAELLVDQGANVIVAATAHRAAYREEGRRRLSRFVEVWVRCTPQVCRSRDPKGLYSRALAGEIQGLPGVDVAYEPPAEPDWLVDGDRERPDDAIAALLDHLPWLAQA